MSFFCVSESEQVGKELDKVNSTMFEWIVFISKSWFELHGTNTMVITTSTRSTMNMADIGIACSRYCELCGQGIEE